MAEEEGLLLLENADLLDLGRAAHAVRQRLHPAPYVTFVADRNINYTNVCICGCKFCAFHRDKDAGDAYVLTYDEVLAKVEELVAAGGTQVLIQGGLNPDIDLEYIAGMFRAIKQRFTVEIHSLSPPEIVHLAGRSGLPVAEVLVRLKEAGLDSLPGGGAEILVNRVRRIISPRKISWQQWMEVMRAAHRLGLKSTATMMFGSVETPAERIRHMIRVRDLQDETGGFTAFIPWTYQPDHTALGGTKVGASAYLRVLAVARLLLDNVPHIQASWVTQGPRVAQIALFFGADDFGSTMMEENVVRAAGATYRIPPEEIIRVVKEAGFTPAQRTTQYRIIRTF
ncbi:MAG TPA: dehypoxanthine futalosine cyclase [Peptococcaceae bacterium]|nr:dehypoxanthine futalosine cyclase [Peptococcaceae bacterium]